MRVFIADVYDAVFDDSALVAVCGRIFSYNSAGALLLHSVEHEGGRRSIFHCIGLTEAQREAFEADTPMADLGVADVTALEPRSVYSNLDHISREDVRASTAWGDHFGQLGAERVDYVCLRRTPTFTTFLSIAYPVRDEDSVRKGVMRLLRQIAPHLARALELRGRRFQDIDAQCSALIGRMCLPVLLFDEDGQLLRCNDPAMHYLSGGVQTEASPGTQLSPRASQRLEDLVEALGDLGDGPRDTFYKDRDGNHVLASTSEYPFPAAPLLRAQWAEESLCFPAALVVLKVAYEEYGGLSEELVGSFRFTPAERRLLEGILAGMTMSEIAEERSVAYNTLRNQLRSVNEKTGIHRQTDLVRIFSSLS